MRTWVKTGVLSVALAWLAAMGVAGARVGAHPAALVGYAIAILGYVALGALSYGPRPQRYVAAGGTGALTLAIAAATFTHLLLLAGGLGVLVAVLLPVTPSKSKDA